MTDYICVQPAYGVKLNSMKAVECHYAADKDFMILSVVHGAGRYINRSNVEQAKGRIKLEIRYGKDGRKAMILPKD